MQLGALAAIVRETVEAQALYPAGRVVVVCAGERGTRRIPLEEYVGWLEILENAFLLRSELIERLTLLYHPARFSPILNLDPSRSVLPDGLAPSVYDAWESMLHVGYVEVPVSWGREAVRITAFWPTLCPPRWISSDPLFYWNGLALIGYTSWIGGLQDVVGEWLRRRQIDAALPEDETDANIPADAGVWLERALSQRLPREDLRGAIDAVVFASWMEEDPNLPLADMLRDYYSLGPHPPTPGTPVGAWSCSWAASRCCCGTACRGPAPRWRNSSPPRTWRGGRAGIFGTRRATGSCGAGRCSGRGSL